MIRVPRDRIAPWDWRAAACSLALAAATGAAYAQLPGLDFVDFDDFAYVPLNPVVPGGLSWEGVRWAFTSIHAGYWAPLLWISYMLDSSLFGTAPAGYHLSNGLLHVANTVLVFELLRRSTGRLGPALAAAALFGLHPVQVESVAWVTERKNVLSAFFGLAAIGCYGNGVAAETPRRGWRLAAIGLTAASLLVKATFATLPVLLLLVDVWPLGRLSLRSRPPGRAIAPLLWEKLPFALLSLAAGLVTFVAQRQGGAVAAIGQLGPGPRLENAVVSYLRYLGSLAWPVDLAFLYPYPSLLGSDMWSAVQVVASGVVLVGITALVLGPGRSRPFLLAGWLWYGVALLPMIGLIQVGDHSIADRHLYVPALGLFVLLAYSAAAVVERYPRGKLAAGVAAVVVASVLGVATRAQVAHWEDSLSLFERAVAVTDGNWIALNNLAWLRATCPDPRVRDGARAVQLAEEACELTRYGEPDLLDTLAVAYAELGRRETAVETSQRALAVARQQDLPDVGRFAARLEALRRGKPIRSAQGCPISPSESADPVRP